MVHLNGKTTGAGLPMTTGAGFRPRQSLEAIAFG
jgi:hypothetical protein